MAKSLKDWGEFGKRLTDFWHTHIWPRSSPAQPQLPKPEYYPVSGFRLYDNLPWPRSRSMQAIDHDVKIAEHYLKESGIGFRHRRFMDVLFTLGAHELEFTLTDANQHQFKITPVNFRLPTKIRPDLIKQEADDLYTILEHRGFTFENRYLAQNALTRMIRIAHEEALHKRPVKEQDPHPGYKGNPGLSNHIK